MSVRNLMMSYYDAMPYEYRKIIDETNEFYTVYEFYQAGKSAAEAKEEVEKILKQYEEQQILQLAYEISKTKAKLSVSNR